MSEEKGAKGEVQRPDPLQVALTAIGDFDRAMVARWNDYGVDPSLETLHQKAQLRVLFALASELRANHADLNKGFASMIGWLDMIDSRVIAVEEAITGGQDDNTAGDDQTVELSAETLSLRRLNDWLIDYADEFYEPDTDSGDTVDAMIKVANKMRSDLHYLHGWISELMGGVQDDNTAA